MTSSLSDGLKEFNDGNYVRAFAMLLPIAESGEAEAQCLIANMFQGGYGVEKNILTSIQWYEKSANQGYGVASNNLGEIYLSGEENISPDKEKAVFWLEKAEKQGFAHTRKLD